ncbi:histone chaperone Rtt106p [Trichomonascus vanleenenianus]|uniref:Rtt106p n=1 Tax=Trichomonascus vanleenenianus TaxID=2268995 RepID=UPI003ECB62EA
MSFVTRLPQELQEEIGALASRDGAALGVLEKLYDYLTAGGVAAGDEGTRKKRRVESDGVVLNGISTVAPERRKFSWVLSRSSIAMAKDPATAEADHSFAASDITLCLCLQVPDRPRPQFNLIIYTRSSGADPAVQATLGDASAASFAAHAAALGANKDLPLYEYVVEYLREQMGLSVEFSKGPTFAAYRGSKEGHLFLLQDHLFFGFKKPVLLVSLDDIESVSYSSITRLTFNMTVKLTPAKGGTEYEFSMIDHAEYDEINTYILENQLSNASMSEARRAKQFTKEYSNELHKANIEAEDTEPHDSKPDTAARGSNNGDAARPNGEEDSSEDEDYAEESDSSEDDTSTSSSSSENEEDE